MKKFYSTTERYSLFSTDFSWRVFFRKSAEDALVEYENTPNGTIYRIDEPQINLMDYIDEIYAAIKEEQEDTEYGNEYINRLEIPDKEALRALMVYQYEFVDENELFGCYAGDFVAWLYETILKPKGIESFYIDDMAVDIGGTEEKIEWRASVDYDNNTESWWDAAENLWERYDDNDKLFTDEEYCDFLREAEKLNGWNDPDAPAYAPHPISFYELD